MSDQLFGLHYTVAAYVCGAACVRPVPFEHFVTFHLMYVNRPDGCRFVVARMVPLNVVSCSNTRGDVVEPGEPRGDWLCWDLLDDSLIDAYQRSGGRMLAAPLPLWQSPSKDGLIMKAMALYDRG